MTALAPDDLSARLETFRAATAQRFPALGAVVLRGGQVVAIGATGNRRWNTTTPVTRDDRWHLGSCTKAITATVAATVVEQGLLRWNSTLGEVFPEETVIPASQRAATLEQLLAHRAGVSANGPTGDFWWTAQAQPGDLPAKRLWVLRNALNRNPQTTPGSAYAYSNLGYVVAAAMLEKVSGQSWEDLVRTRLAEPLGLASLGFGPMVSGPSDTSQPWGHTGSAGNWTPNATADNPAVMGPAGNIHLSLSDWARFIAATNRLARGEPVLGLGTATAAELSRSRGDDYALGWIVTERSWANGQALTHGGSNTLHSAYVWAAPRVDFAILLVTNCNRSDTFTRLDALTGELLTDYLLNNGDADGDGVSDAWEGPRPGGVAARPQEDRDGNGRADLLDYALGGGWQLVPGAGAWSYSFLRPNGAARLGLSYLLEAAPSMAGPWQLQTPLTVQAAPALDRPGFETVSGTLLASAPAANGAAVWRLRVVAPGRW